MNSNKIILRTPYKITKAYLCPCKIPGTMRYPDCVRPVNGKGEARVTREDIYTGRYYISELDVIEIYDGKVFDLDDEIENAQWKAIEHHKVIAKARDERNEDGELIIDGNARKYGTADWYVEIPGLDANNKNEIRRKRLEAQNHIIMCLLASTVLLKIYCFQYDL